MIWQSENALSCQRLSLFQLKQVDNQVARGFSAPAEPLIDAILRLEPSIALRLEHSFPDLVGRVAVVAPHLAQLDVPIRLYAHFALQPAHFLQVRTVLRPFAPDDVSVQLVSLQQQEELLAVCLILVVVVDRGSLSVKDPYLLLAHQNMVDDFDSPLLVHPSGQFLPAAERAQDGLSVLLVLDGPDAVAAELVLAGESGRREDDIRADGAEDVVVKILEHARGIIL